MRIMAEAVSNRKIIPIVKESNAIGSADGGVARRSMDVEVCDCEILADAIRASICKNSVGVLMICKSGTVRCVLDSSFSRVRYVPSYVQPGSPVRVACPDRIPVR